MKKWLFLLCCAFSLLLNAASGKAVPSSEKKILVLASFHLAHDWTAKLTDTIQADSKNFSPPPQITIVAFDMMRVYESQNSEKKLLHYLSVIQKGKFDMIVALDSPIMNLLLENSDKVPAGIPIVFGGCENISPDIKQKHPNITGVIQKDDAEGTLRAGLALYPDTRTVMVLSDDSPESREFEQDFKARIPSIKGVDFIFVNNADMAIEEIHRKIANLPENALLMLSPWRGLGGNDYQSLPAFGMDISQFSKRPYLVNCTGMFNHGALGGMITDPVIHGHEVSRLMEEVLKKGSARDIPLTYGKMIPLFDWHEMTGNNLDGSRLPKDAVYLNQPVPVWKEHQNVFLSSLGVIFLVIGGAAFYVHISRKSLKRGRDILRILPGRVGIINRAEKVLFLSARDLDKQELSDVYNLSDIPRFDYEKVSTAMRDVFATGENKILEYDSHGDKRAMFLKPVPRELFGEEAVVWFSHDNTELQETRKEAQEYAEKLKRSTRMWDLVVNALPIHIFAKAPADDYRFVFSNKGMQDFTSLSNKEICGKTDFDVYPKETATIIRNDDERNMLDLEHGVENVVPIPDATGKIHPMRMITWPFVEADGSCLLIGAAFDATELEQAKHKAEESAEWFRLTLNSIGDGVITTDRAGKITMMNPVAERMTGVPREEALGKPHDQVFRIYNYDNDRPSPSPVMRTLRTGVIVELANHTDLLAKDGTRYHIADSAAPIFGPDNKILGAILVFRDVTEEYAQRDLLRYAHAQQEAGAKISKSATFVFNPTTKKITGSVLLPKLLPVVKDRVKDIKNWIYEEDLPLMRTKWAELARGEVSSATFDYRTKDKDGFHYFRLSSSIDRSDPRQVMFTGVVQDITDIRRVFDQLKDQQNLWEKVINSIPLCFFAKDANDDFRYVLCNQTFAAFVGRTPEEVIGKTDVELFSQPGDAEGLRAADRRIINQPDGEEVEESAVDHKGERHYWQSVKKPFTGIDGRRLLLGASSDITDLKQLLSCEKLNSEVLAVTAKHDDFDTMLDEMAGILMKHMNCDRIMLARCNRHGLPRLYKEWLSPGTFSIRESNLEKHYELWDRNISEFRANHILKTSDITQADFCPGLTRNDKYRTISLIVAPVFVDDQLWGALFVSYSHIRQVFNDIDERIMRSCANVISMAQVSERQRHTIQQANHERQLVLDNIHIPIWLHDNRGELIRANTAVGDLFGIPAAELTTEKNKEILAPAFSAGTVQPIEESLKTGRAVQREIRLLGRDFIISAEPVFDSLGHLAYIVKAAIDMTEFNELLSSRTALSACLETLIGEPKLEKALAKMLQTLCAHLGASRAYIYRFNEETRTMSVLVEHVADNGKAILSTVKDQPYAASPNWYDRFADEQTIIIDDISRARVEEYGTFRQKMIALADMRSIYATRLITHKNIWGYLGLIYEHHPRSLDEEALQFLQSSAHFIEVMLEREQVQEQLQENLENTRRSEQRKAELLMNEQTINNCLNALFREENVGDSIQTVLKAINTRFGAARSYILRISPEEKTQKIYSEYMVPGEIPMFEEGKIYPLDETAPWYEKLLRNETVAHSDLNDPEQIAILGDWMEHARQYNMRSLYVARIQLDGKLWGDLGVIYQGENQVDFSESDLELLNSAAHLIEVMLQRQQSRDQLVKAMQKAQAADKAKSFFIASVSHEIRTPLNAVIGFSDLLRDGDIPEAEAKEYLASISYSGNALLQLINDVLDLSKLEANQMKIEPAPADFRELSEEVMKVFQYRAGEQQIELRIDMPPLPEMELDKLRIRQVLFNLIGNAVKFTNEGSVTLKAECQPNGDGTCEFTFMVIDTGPGIAPEDQAKLMKPFVQLSRIRGTDANNNGTGLGLTISKRLIEKMKGSLWLKSEPGKGSVFGASLHRIRISKDSTASESSKAAVLSCTAEAAALSILIVDDVALNLRVMKALCHRAGIGNIETALSGEEALAMLKKQPFDLVLTDMWMPEMTGVVLAEKIRGDKRFQDIPILAVTADVEAKDNFPLEYFDGVLLKPVTIEKVHKMLDFARNPGRTKRNNIILNELRNM